MPETKENHRLLNLTDAAKYLGVGRQSMETAVETKQIPSVRIGGRIMISTAVLDQKLAEALGTQEQPDA